MSSDSVLTGYVRSRDFELKEQAVSANNGLTGNASFQIDATKMTDFQIALENYSDLLEKVKTGTRLDVQLKNDAKKVLIGLMKYLALQVNSQAAGETAKLMTSGFPLVKQRTKLGQLPKPTDFKVTAGRNPGDLIFDVDAHPGCNVYLFFFSPVPGIENPKEMKPVISTSHKKKVGNFISGTQYRCYCAYQGVDDELVYSDPVFIYAQ